MSVVRSFKRDKDIDDIDLLLGTSSEPTGTVVGSTAYFGSSDTHKDEADAAESTF